MTKKKTKPDRYRTRWGISSFTNPDKVYKVSEDWNGDFACSCPAWIFSNPRKPCKHVHLVLQSTNSELADKVLKTYNIEALPAADWKIVVMEDNSGNLHVMNTRDYGDRE